ncbi:methyltransferase domain-containing protein [Methanopyrus sp. KOL6]|uniref:methyltransferase domain-containing protein n=1 Tax=Methanopyrus sp. KOL6 TaxID=1937004 RepID=UPI0012FCA180|nr:methyltransferase domain-containing protein [Methanopyrus sp. KOL6]
MDLDRLKVSSFERVTRPIEPKDSGLITERLGLLPGHRVFESGVGSGFLTASIARIVYPDGEVVGIEIDVRKLKKARENLEQLGKVYERSVTLKHGDAREYLEGLEDEFDAMVLDLPEPDRVLEVGLNAIKSNGKVAVFCPFFEQVRAVWQILEDRCTWLEAVELIERKLQVEKRGIRPGRTLGHTGFIVFGRV